ncbi:RsiV family protein [Pedobacter sp. PWIIR3]
MKKPIALLLLTLLFACNAEENKEELADSTSNVTVSAVHKTDSINFKYDSVKVYSKNPVSKDSRVTDTAKAVITHPVFPSEKINTFVSKKILATADELKYNDYKNYAQGFIDEFDSFQLKNKDRIQTWFLDINTSVVKATVNYISIKTRYVNFSGGAHPNSMFIYANYNPKTNQEINLDSLLLPDGQKKLEAIAEKIFRRNEKLGEQESLKNKYFFENDKFSLNRNFTVTDKGLLFLYNPYEIKAYVYGTTELLIPFSALKEVAKPSSLLTNTN